jgi:hypothetical protein
MSLSDCPNCWETPYCRKLHIAENAELRDALEFYADEKHRQELDHYDELIESYGVKTIHRFFGKKAREVLAKYKKDST